jgi:leucyl aminopeptidase
MNYLLSLNKSGLPESTADIFVFISGENKLPESNFLDDFSPAEKLFIEKQYLLKNNLFLLSGSEKYVFIQFVNANGLQEYKLFENFRISGTKLQKELRKYKISSINIHFRPDEKSSVYYLEGLLLSDYRFLKYKSEYENSVLNNINIISESITETELDKLKISINAVFWGRDLVNEPGSVLTALELAERITQMGIEAGFSTEVLNKKKIEALKMGGLLAVNSGSLDPPAFIILHHNPGKKLNKKPVVLVGKGLVFDTGGLSLKPTLNSMDEMKSDMAGAAVVASVIYALAKMKAPLEVFGLIPATDNRPGVRACFPGDVITISNGTTVEILNTDAEGRLILADALSYAKKLDPEIVIDLATLTGSASAAVGKYAIVAFTNMGDDIDEKLVESSRITFERIIQFPLWDEYGELIKSDVADLKNTGGKEAGAITAAKFLQHFTDYPWIHFDIAGVSFSTSETNYVPKGGTGTGIRLLINYLTEKFVKYDHINS